MSPPACVRRRPALNSDLAAVHTLYMHPAVVPFLGYDPMPLTAFAPVYDELLHSGEFFVYPVAGQLGGFYRVRRFSGRAQHVAQLCTLAVAPVLHGQGIARAMLDECLRLLRAQEVLRVELTVEADNPRAIAFYRRLGFEYEGTLKKFYKRAGEAGFIDEQLMALLF